MAGFGGQKFKGAKTAVGYWGRSTWKRVQLEQTPQRVRVWLEDKLIARGKRVGLWLPVGNDTVNVVTPCTCAREATDASQRRCDSCYGTKVVPGYKKFMHETIFFSSAETSLFTLSNTGLSTAFKPFTIQISPGSLSGQIITPDKPFSNPQGASYSVGMNAFLRAPGASIVMEYSINGGLSYTVVPLSGGGGLLVGTIPGSVVTGAGTIRLRITLSRVNASDPTTSFEIVRMRRPKPEVMNQRLRRERPDMQPGEILIDRTWVREVVSMDPGGGRGIGHLADGTWTAPLDFFDATLMPDVPTCRIDDTGPGPHPFYEYTDGVLSTDRYPLYEVDIDTNMGIFTYQAFLDFHAQPQDAYQLIF